MTLSLRRKRRITAPNTNRATRAKALACAAALAGWLATSAAHAVDPFGDGGATYRDQGGEVPTFKAPPVPKPQPTSGSPSYHLKWRAQPAEAAAKPAPSPAPARPAEPAPVKETGPALVAPKSDAPVKPATASLVLPPSDPEPEPKICESTATSPSSRRAPEPRLAKLDKAPALVTQPHSVLVNKPVEKSFKTVAHETEDNQGPILIEQAAGNEPLSRTARSIRVQQAFDDAGESGPAANKSATSRFAPPEEVPLPVVHPSTPSSAVPSTLFDMPEPPTTVSETTKSHKTLPTNPAKLNNARLNAAKANVAKQSDDPFSKSLIEPPRAVPDQLRAPADEGLGGDRCPPGEPCRDVHGECKAAWQILHKNPLSNISLDIRVKGTQGQDYPCDCPVQGETFVPRNWACITYTWKASGICYHPLWFEEPDLERYGHNWGHYIQPFASGAHFFANILLLPYHMGEETLCECIYPLGYYRPGDCAPMLCPAVPLSCRGGLSEAGVITALIFIVP